MERTEILRTSLSMEFQINGLCLQQAAPFEKVSVVFSQKYFCRPSLLSKVTVLVMIMILPLSIECDRCIYQTIFLNDWYGNAFSNTLEGGL